MRKSVCAGERRTSVPPPDVLALRFFRFQIVGDPLDGILIYSPSGII